MSTSLVKTLEIVALASIAGMALGFAAVWFFPEGMEMSW
jgi:hypothetical protein